MLANKKIEVHDKNSDLKFRSVLNSLQNGLLTKPFLPAKSRTSVKT